MVSTELSYKCDVKFIVVYRSTLFHKQNKQSKQNKQNNQKYLNATFAVYIEKKEGPPIIFSHGSLDVVQLAVFTFIGIRVRTAKSAGRKMILNL